MSLTDIFKKEVQDLSKADKAAGAHLNMVGECARQCLSMDQFFRYKEQYEKAEAQVIKAMMMLTDAYASGSFDLTTYATKTLVYMTRLKEVRRLLDATEFDAKKGRPHG